MCQGTGTGRSLTAVEEPRDCMRSTVTQAETRSVVVKREHAEPLRSEKAVWFYSEYSGKS